MYKLKATTRSLKEDIYTNNLAVVIDWNTGLFYVPNAFKKIVVDMYGVDLGYALENEQAITMGKYFKGEKNILKIKETILNLNRKYFVHHSQASHENIEENPKLKIVK